MLRNSVFCGTIPHIQVHFVYLASYPFRSIEQKMLVNTSEKKLRHANI